MTSETKSEIQARQTELLAFWEKARDIVKDGPTYYALEEVVDLRHRELSELETVASDDLFKSVVRSHEVLCKVKQMDQKAAYGQDPAMYYTLAICGEAGEMANKIVKALRNGDDPNAVRNAVISELPDVIIYSGVLASVLDIDLTKEVNDKVGIVIQRAESGYYGGALPEGVRGRV